MPKPSTAENPRIQIDPEQLAAITEYADVVGVSVQDAIKEALQDFIDVVIEARLGE